MPEFLTNPVVMAAVGAALFLLAKKKPALAAALKAIWESMVGGGVDKTLASANAPEESRCEVLKGVRYQISEQSDPEQRAKDLALCDEFRAMLKRLSELKVAA